jgi:hypothetical protein
MSKVLKEQKLIFDKHLEEYNKEEDRCKNIFGIFVVESFKYHFFNYRGRQTQISEFGEIYKFIDTMQENRFEENVRDGLLGAITDNEFRLFKKITKEIYDSSNFFQSRVFGISTLSRAIVQYRILKSVCPMGKVLEVGPGSGYLGALICNDDEYKYTGYEITQSFYITQKFLWESVTNKEVHDVFNSFKYGSINHMPWFKFADLNFDLPKYDCITANHVFAEMHPWALKFSIKRLYECLEANGYLVCESLGDSSLISNEQVLNEIILGGFELVHRGLIEGVTKFNECYVFKKNKSTGKGNVDRIPPLTLAMLSLVKFFKIRRIINLFKGHPKCKGIFTKNNLEYSIDDMNSYVSSIDPNIDPSSNESFLKYIDG